MPEKSTSISAADPAPASRSRCNLDLALLIMVLIIINAPYLSPVFLPGHDTRFLFLMFHEFYRHVFWTNSIPRWLPTDYGYPSAIWQLQVFSPGEYFVALAGLAVRSANTLLLFKLSCLADQLVLLLGTYLLAKRLYSRRLTVFLVTLAAICSTVWYYQIVWNFRVYYPLPLIIYFGLRFVTERRPTFLWLGGAVMVIASLGGLPYWIPVWMFFLLVLFIVLIIQRRQFSIRPARPSLLGVLAFVAVVALSIAYVVWAKNSLDGLHNYNLGRSLDGMRTSRWTFLFYSPPLAYYLDGFLDIASTQVDLTLYIGLLFIPAFFIAMAKVRSPIFLSIIASTLALLLLAACGTFSWVAYYLPGMNMVRHVGNFAAICKIMVLLAAGFGLDYVLFALDSAADIKRWYTLTNVILATTGAWIIADAGLGMAIYNNRNDHSWFVAVGSTGEWVMLYRMLAYSMIFVLPYAMLRIGRWSDFHLRQRIKLLMAFAVLADCVLFQYQAYALRWISTKSDYDGVLTLDKPAYFPQRAVALDPGMFDKYVRLMNGPGVRYSLVAPLIGYDPPYPVSPVWKRGTIYNTLTVPMISYDPPHPIAPVGEISSGRRNVESLRLDLFPEGVHQLITARGGRPEQYPTPDFLPKNDDSLMRVMGIDSPKLRIVRDYVVAQSPEQLKDLLTQTARIDAVAILRNADPDDLKSGRPAEPEAGSHAANIAVTQFDYNHMEIKADIGVNVPAWLVYADGFDPHWIATVNGHPARVAEAYGAFKAVFLKEPTSIVKFTYRNAPSAIASDVLAASGIIFFSLVLATLGYQLGPRAFSLQV